MAQNNSKKAAAALLSGISKPDQQSKKSPAKSTQVVAEKTNIEAQPEFITVESTAKVRVTPLTGEKENNLVPQGIYITVTQKKQIKILTATSDLPEHKDISSVIRAAIDDYLKSYYA